MGRGDQIQIKVTVSPEQDAVLQELATGLHIGKATVVRMLIDESLPMLGELLELVRSEDQRAVLSYVRKIILRAQEEAEQLRLPEQFRVSGSG